MGKGDFQIPTGFVMGSRGSCLGIFQPAGSLSPGNDSWYIQVPIPESIPLDAASHFVMPTRNLRRAKGKTRQLARPSIAPRRRTNPEKTGGASAPSALEARLRLAMSAANVGFWDMNLVTREIHFSPELRRQLGCGRAEMPDLYEAWESRLHPDDRREVLRRLRAMLTGRTNHYEAEYRLRHKDGSYRWIDARGLVLRQNDHSLHATGVHLDVTERKAAEAELAGLAAIVESSADAIFSRDAEGMVRTWNAGAARILGYSAEEIVGRPVTVLIPPDRMKEATEVRKLLSRGRGVGSHYETVRVAKNGRRVPVSVTNSVIRTADGRAIGISTVLRDATRQRQYEEALVENERNLSEFFNQSPVGLLWVAADGKIERVNQAALDLIGTTRARCLHHDLLEFQADSDVFMQLLSRVAKGETVQNERVRLRRPDGSCRHTLVDANCFRARNALVRTQWFVRDITERVELEGELLDISEREQRRIAQDLHDGLGQLLSALMHLTAQLEADLATSCPAEVDKAARLMRLLDEALFQTRSLARGLYPVRPVPDGLMLALGELAARTRDLFHCNCRFRCPEPVAVEDNSLATHLYRIAQEAVLNALMHGRARKITIGLSATPARLMVGVRDDGLGIDEPVPRNKGMGIRIMRYRTGMIGGSLAIQNETSGGTNVVCTVHLPLTRPEAYEKARPNSRAQGKRGPGRGGRPRRATPENPYRGGSSDDAGRPAWDHRQPTRSRRGR